VLLLGFDLVHANADDLGIERVELAAPSAKLGCFPSSAGCTGTWIEEDNEVVVASILAEVDRFAIL
jgi:hypothetical protein